MASRNTASFKSLARSTGVIIRRRPINIQIRGFQTSPQQAQQQQASNNTATHKPSSSSYPHYPSVQHLLQSNNISSTEAAKIPASGPNGRLLKGDVLAHLGTINSTYPSDLSARLTQLSRLDLKDAKPAPTATPTPPAKEAQQQPTPLPEVPTEITIPISLHAVQAVQARMERKLGIHLPISTFIARATELSNLDLPRSKHTPLTADELFDALLGFDDSIPKTARGRFVPKVVTSLPSSSSSSSSTTSSAVAGSQKHGVIRHDHQEDIYDVLSGRKKEKARSSSARENMKGIARPELLAELSSLSSSSSSRSIFAVSVQKGDEFRARRFLERVKSVLEVEPGSLIL